MTTDIEQNPELLVFRACAGPLIDQAQRLSTIAAGRFPLERTR